MIEISAAPMMGYTDRWFRLLLRRIAPSSVLFTEMIHANAILSERASRILSFDPKERPVVLQIAGNDPPILARAAAIGERYGYDAINFNLGCPSPRVHKAEFGAALMARPRLAARCLEAIRNAVAVPVSAKIRTGYRDTKTERSSLQFLVDFAGMLAEAGAQTLIVHARKALLDGSSARKNRVIPALQSKAPSFVKKNLPHLRIIYNGEIDSLDTAKLRVQNCDGIMVGRALCKRPLLLAELEQGLSPSPFSHSPEHSPKQIPQPQEILEIMLADLSDSIRERAKSTSEHAKNNAENYSIKRMTRYWGRLFSGHAHARAWRVHLARSRTVEDIEKTLNQMRIR